MCIDNAITICRTCAGAGKVETGIQAYPLTRCGTCEGVGSGVVERVPCPACNGAHGVPCSHCGGTGSVSRFKAVTTN